MTVSLLYLPNEASPGDQVGPRLAFESMHREGRLRDYSAYSYLVEAKRHGAAVALSRLKELVAEWRPDLLLWQHVGRFPLRWADVESLRAAAPRMHLLYHEGDVYGRWVKPLPPSTRLLMAAADTVALVGRGSYAKLARSAGAKRVVYSPHSADTERFGQPWKPTTERDFDVLLIGNRIHSRLPWRRMPGAARRIELVRALGRRFGKRFAVYGRGWEGFTGNQGSIDFALQEATQRRAWVTVSWDHFDQVEAYFSDRVPISLMSGVPHVTNHQPGYESVFGPNPPLCWAKNVAELVARAEDLLALGPAGINEIGRQAQEYCNTRFTAEVVYPRLIAEVMGIGQSPGLRNSA